MTEVRVIGGTISDAIHFFFEQKQHITFPVHPFATGSAASPAGQDPAHTVQEQLPPGHLPQGGLDSHAPGSFGDIEAMSDPHHSIQDAHADWINAVTHGFHWSDIA